MKLLQIFIFSFMYSGLIMGANITGKVVVASTGKPLEFAQLSLVDFISNKLVVGTTTDAIGNFKLSDLEYGKYMFRITFIGYQSVEIPIVFNERRPDMKLGVIQMAETTHSLKQLNVVGQKSQMRFELDKKVFNVDQSVIGAGTSATELLRNIPSVEVAADGNILLRNNKNVIIWINGRPSGLNTENQAQVLEQIPSETIEKVEIISNPSAKYSPEGSAGIINIVLKRAGKLGVYGGVTAGIDTNPSKNLSFNLFLNKSRWEFNLNAGYRNDVKNMFFNSNRWSWNTLTADTVVRYSRDVVKIDGGGYFARGSAIFHASKKDEIGLSTMFTTANRNVTEDINNRRLKSGVETLDYRFTDAGSMRNLYDASLDYTHKFDKKGHELKAYVSINHNNAYSDAEITQKDSLKKNLYFQWSNGVSTRTETTLQTDYTYPLTDSVKLELGYKGEFLKRDNSTIAESGTDNNNRAQQYELSNLFGGSDKRNSVYLNLSGKRNKWSWQAGLRAEYNTLKNTSTTYTAIGKDTATVFDYNYPGLYPSMFLDYNLPADNKLQLNYTRRINRPKGRMINPFINMADSSNIEFGNPNLKPEFTNALEFSHIKTWEKHMLSTVLYFRSTQNVVQWVNYVISSSNFDTKYITPKNITNSQSAGLELISKNKLVKTLDLTTTINVFYSHLDKFSYAGTSYAETKNVGWSGRMIANMALPAGISAQLSGGYMSRKKIAQGETLPIWGMDAGVRKSFFDKKLTVNLTARDIAKTRVSKDIAKGYNFYDYSYYQFNARSVGVVLTYNFGRQPKKATSTKANDPNPLGGDF